MQSKSPMWFVASRPEQHYEIDEYGRNVSSRMRD